MRAALLLIALLGFGVAQAATEMRQFDTPAHEATYRELTEELRCTVCQNQNIADSHAELAADLRDKTYRMVVDGKSKDEIKQYMVARYGNFVLYDPPVTPGTLLLWLGPFLFLVFGGLLLVRLLRRRRARPQTTIDEAQRRRAAELLGGKEDPHA